MLSTRLGTHTPGESTVHLDEATPHLSEATPHLSEATPHLDEATPHLLEATSHSLHQLHVTAVTRSDEHPPLGETMSPPSCSSTPRKLSTSS